MYDLVIIGAGPGGYVAALRAGQLGMKVACIDKAEGGIGGTCLNVGCIPSKALLHASHLYHDLQHHHGDWGISTKEAKVDVKKMQAKKESNVTKLVDGIKFLFKKNKVEFIPGAASFKDASTVMVKNGSKTQEVKAKNFMIATGSRPIAFPDTPFDENLVLSSTGCLDLKKVPKTMTIIGGGYIGVEMASVWSRLGTDVTVVEYADRIVPNMDVDISNSLLKVLKKQGIKFLLGTRVLEIKKTKDSVKAMVETMKDKGVSEVVGEKLMVSIGRHPVTDTLDLKKAGVETDEKGFIKVQDDLQTSQKNIFAIGDVIGGAMLAHKAEEEGVRVVEAIHNGNFHQVNYELIPAVIFTHPEAASVGLTEAQVQEAGTPYRVGQFSFAGNSRAKAVSSDDGFVKLIAHEQTDEIIGAHILGEHASSLIAELALGMEFKVTAEDIAHTTHAHPTFSEAVKEAALAVHKRAVHA